MCELLGFGATTLGFESSVRMTRDNGTEGMRLLETGACASITFNWDFKKPGGMPPK